MIEWLKLYVLFCLTVAGALSVVFGLVMLIVHAHIAIAITAYILLIAALFATIAYHTS